MNWYFGASQVAMAAVTGSGAWLVTTPEISFAIPPHGAGDLCAALFSAALLDSRGGDRAAVAALSQTASAIYALLDETARVGKGELALVEAQDLLVAPPKLFHAETIALST